MISWNTCIKCFKKKKLFHFRLNFIIKIINSSYLELHPKGVEFSVWCSVRHIDVVPGKAYNETPYPSLCQCSVLCELRVQLHRAGGGECWGLVWGTSMESRKSQEVNTRWIKVVVNNESEELCDRCFDYQADHFFGSQNIKQCHKSYDRWKLS